IAGFAPGQVTRAAELVECDTSARTPLSTRNLMFVAPLFAPVCAAGHMRPSTRKRTTVVFALAPPSTPGAVPPAEPPVEPPAPPVDALPVVALAFPPGDEELSLHCARPIEPAKPSTARARARGSKWRDFVLIPFLPLGEWPPGAGLAYSILPR